MQDDVMTHVKINLNHVMLYTIYKEKHEQKKRLNCRNKDIRRFEGKITFLLSLTLQLIFPVLHFVILFVQLLDTGLDLV